MAKQPKYRWPDMPSEFFADGRATRPIDPNTVARGQLRDDEALYTGLSGPGNPDEPAYVKEIPLPVQDDQDAIRLMQRGRERYTIFCSVCHGLTGYGDGKVVQRGYLKPPSYHDPRLREMPVGRIFEVVTKGYGAMPSYNEQIPADDRWAIISYIRALQFSQNVPAGELTEAERAKFREAEKQKRKEAEPKVGGDRGH